MARMPGRQNTKKSTPTPAKATGVRVAAPMEVQTDGASPPQFVGTDAVTRKGRERVLKILAACQDVLLSHGYGGLTLRLVADRAKIAQGNVQYYFPTRERLLESLALSIETAFRRDLTTLVEGSPEDPLECLRRYVRYNIDANRTTTVIVTFAELRALSHRTDFIMAALDNMYLSYRERLEQLIAGVNPSLAPETLKLRAALIISLIDGLMNFLGARNVFDASLADRLADDAEREAIRLALQPAEAVDAAR